MIHHHSIGDAKITGVIEYSGPTHPPDFLYPAVDKAERDAVLKANASWLAPNHYAPNIDRLVVTPLASGASGAPAVAAGGGALSPSMGPASLVSDVPGAASGGASRRRIVARVRGSAFGRADPRAARRLASVMWVFAVAGLVTPVAALALRGVGRSQRGEWRP